MIISKGRGYVFVHIPKTGGTSLSLALEQRAMKDDILIGDTPKAIRRRNRVKVLNARGRLWKHATLADIDGVLSPSELDAMFVFTLVRNPWDRMVSYYHWLQDQRFDHPAVGLSQQLGFEDFVLHPSIRRSFKASPAHHYVTDVNGTERCRLYIRLEHFQDDAIPLFDHLGFSFSLPVSNQSPRSRDYQSYFTDRSRDAVASDNAEAISRFGYVFTS